MYYKAILNKQKCHLFSLTNSEQEGRTGLVWGVGTSVRGRRCGKGVGG
jgi:hypothetical protein